jgi:PAS domain S-box-containing protein
MSGFRAMGGDVERALESVNVPSYVLDKTGVIRWVNPAAQKMLGGIDVRGRQFTSVVALEETRRARELFAQKVVGGVAVTDVDTVFVDGAGERVDVELSSVPLTRGGQVIGVFGQFTRAQRGQPSAPSHPALTPRQTEVLRQLERGRSTKQIAAELHLSTETVRNHVRHLLHALGVNSRLEAVAAARAHHVAD